MTTVAFDGKVIAVDSRAVAGVLISNDRVEKILVKDNVAFAIAGTFCMFRPLIKWFIDGGDIKEIPTGGSEDNDCTSFIVCTGGRCFQYNPKLPYPDEIHPPFSWGTGREIALGAMLAGKSAVEAVRIAATVDPSTGGDIRFVNLESPIKEVEYD